MKNKFKSKNVLAHVFRKSAFVLAAAVALSVTASAEVAEASSNSGTITGDSSVRGDVFKVLLPVNLNFELNPYGEGKITPTSQITATDYVVVNKTHLPVLVDFNIEAEPATGVDLVGNPGVLSVNDQSDVTKKAYFAILGAKSFTGTVNFDSGALATNSNFTYDAVTKSSALVPFPAATGGSKTTAKIGFALGAATASGSVGSASTVNTLAAQNKGIASFQFFARMNTYADWKASDLKVSATYSITSLHPSSYDVYKTKVAANTLNQYVA